MSSDVLDRESSPLSPPSGPGPGIALILIAALALALLDHLAVGGVLAGLFEDAFPELGEAAGLLGLGPIAGGGRLAAAARRGAVGDERRLAAGPRSGPFIRAGLPIRPAGSSGQVG